MAGVIDVKIPLVQILIFGLVFDAALFIVVVAHIRFVSRLNAQIMALEASTDILLDSQTELNRVLASFLSKIS